MQDAGGHGLFILLCLIYDMEGTLKTLIHVAVCCLPGHLGSSHSLTSVGGCSPTHEYLLPSSGLSQNTLRLLVPVPHVTEHWKVTRRHCYWGVPVIASHVSQMPSVMSHISPSSGGCCEM